MDGISDIKISGIDETRPPRIQKEPYIDLFFKLVHKAPADWCEDFNLLVKKRKYSAKIKPDTGLIIETYVRTPDEIESTLQSLKEAVSTCNKEYIVRIQARSAQQAENNNNLENTGEQGRLNKIIAGLNFSN